MYSMLLSIIQPCTYIATSQSSDDLEVIEPQGSISRSDSSDCIPSGIVPLMWLIIARVAHLVAASDHCINHIVITRVEILISDILDAYPIFSAGSIHHHHGCLGM